MFRFVRWKVLNVIGLEREEDFCAPFTSGSELASGLAAVRQTGKQDERRQTVIFSNVEHFERKLGAEIFP